MLTFSTIATAGAARAGVLATPHGVLATPAFMPVATQAAVKAAGPDEVVATGARMVIMNTYHLWLRPGPEVVAELGGLHGFSRWPLVIATDSGGFQAFSLAERTRVSEAGFEFASHLDGRRLLLSPEESMRVQGLLGSDIALQLDVCPPGGAERPVLVDAVDRTTRWAERCLGARRPDQALFGIVQGGTDIELRLSHAEALGRLPLDGLALGGFSVGEPRAEMYRALAAVGPRLDPLRPRYLMGVGTPLDLVDAIGCGIDLFDCVLPTRNARNGQAFVADGKISLRNARFRADARPLEVGCPCPACSRGFSRAYLRHLFMAGEILFHRLVTLHNITFYQRIVRAARTAVVEGNFAAWATGCRDRWASAGAGEVGGDANPRRDAETVE
ncbi:MAG: tRNA guanosine(34) transglycosylase Tgt [Polyangiaceae bacterium]|nr:tRNA guanosine(34) transglycosylase Tgt [Polyangiaceae bacterium]